MSFGPKKLSGKLGSILGPIIFIEFYWALFFFLVLYWNFLEKYHFRDTDLEKYHFLPTNLKNTTKFILSISI